MHAVVFLSLIMGSAGADTAAGERLYQANCAACHGAELDGNGAAGAALRPTPSNFKDSSFWEGRDASSLKASIKNGKPGTAMMSFVHLPDSQTEAIVAYLVANKP